MAEGKGFDDSRAFWDQRFAAPDYIFGRAPNEFLVSQAGLFKPGMSVLDVAGGEGRNAVWLALQGCRVTAVDISPKGLEKARRLASEHGAEVRFELADVRDYDWPLEAFDVVPLGVLTTVVCSHFGMLLGTRFWKNELPLAPSGNRWRSTGRPPIAASKGSRTAA